MWLLPVSLFVQMVAVCSAQNLPVEQVEVMGGGTMEWMKHRCVVTEPSCGMAVRTVCQASSDCCCSTCTVAVNAAWAPLHVQHSAGVVGCTAAAVVAKQKTCCRLWFKAPFTDTCVLCGVPFARLFLQGPPPTHIWRLRVPYWWLRWPLQWH